LRREGTHFAYLYHNGAIEFLENINTEYSAILF